MEWGIWILVVVVVVIVAQQTIFTDKTPIPETSAKVQKVTKPAELIKILSSTTDVIVDFYADWCPPCRAIAPVFSALAEEHAVEGRLAFVKINVDHVKDVAVLYEVTAMPTFVVFRGGKPEGVKVEGLSPRENVERDEEGRVERIKGGDKVALEGVVKALVG